MSQKQKNKEHILLANTQGQALKEHSMAVALYGHLLLKSLKFKEDTERKLNKCLIYAGLLHDIGKVSQDFQKYIQGQIKSNSKDDLKDMPMDAESSRPKSFSGPFHNEISWAYIANFFDFQNTITEDIVQHSIYWHHSANWCDEKNKIRFENAREVLEKLKKEEINNISQFVCNLFSAFSSYDKNFQSAKTKDFQESIKRIQYPYFFEHKLCKVADNATKQLCLNLLLESDRQVSSWKPKELNQFLGDWKNQKDLSKENPSRPILEKLNKNPKSKEQYDLAEKMSNKKLAVCGVDPAGGKTSVALYWWHHCQNKPLMIALPRQHQVTGLFHSIKEDCKRIFGKDHNIKIEGVFNGKRQHDNWNAEESNELLTSDINIMVFDRFLSPYYKRSQSSEFIKMLQSHLVLDEFHEFKEIPKMIPALREILTIRSCWLGLDSGVKTLMLSGTPEPSLLKLININVENSCVFKRDKLSPRKDHKFKFFAKESKTEDIKEFKPDNLYSFLRVEACQEVFARMFKSNDKDQIKMIHTYFTDKDKKNLLESILQEHSSKEIFISKKSVITSKMLQSSYNLSFQKALVELSQPHADGQTAGRINRFENKTDAEIHFIFNDETKKFFDKAGFKEIHKKWKEHLLKFIEQQGGKVTSIRELMTVYDDFWTEENIKTSCEILTRQQQKAIEYLNGYTPKRFPPGKKKGSSRSLNSLFRGESRLLSACVVDDNLKPTCQLQCEDLLSESRDWFIKEIVKAMEICLKTKEKCGKANQVNNEEVFEFNKHAKYFGFKAERPLLCSHYDEDVDKRLSENLKKDNNKTDHQVYHKKFGLVKKELLSTIKKK